MSFCRDKSGRADLIFRRLISHSRLDRDRCLFDAKPTINFIISFDGKCRRSKKCSHSSVSIVSPVGFSNHFNMRQWQAVFFHKSIPCRSWVRRSECHLCTALFSACALALALILSLMRKWTVSLRQDPPLDLSFWSFLTFLHHGIEEVERHLLWKFYKTIRRKSWSNVPPKLLACIGFLYKVVHKIGRLRKFNRSRGI